MEFQIANIQQNANSIMRHIGYMPAFFQKAGEFSIVRKIDRNEYPRFHLYIKESKSYKLEAKSYTFNLHLDQKKPSYEGQTGHSGDYDGPVVENEAERIKQILK
ncbi:MAG: hypothetical protein AAB877_03455 [Patescibacteria group bacterium]